MINAIITKALQSRLTCLTLSVSLFLLHVILAFICECIDDGVLRRSFIVMYPWPAALTYAFAFNPEMGRIGLGVGAALASIELYIYTRWFLLGRHWQHNGVVVVLVLLLTHGVGIGLCEIFEAR
jgi:hypothetical protein